MWDSYSSRWCTTSLDAWKLTRQTPFGPKKLRHTNTEHTQRRYATNAPGTTVWSWEGEGLRHNDHAIMALQFQLRYPKCAVLQWDVRRRIWGCITSCQVFYSLQWLQDCIPQKAKKVTLPNPAIIPVFSVLQKQWQWHPCNSLVYSSQQNWSSEVLVSFRKKQMIHCTGLRKPDNSNCKTNESPFPSPQGIEQAVFKNIIYPGLKFLSWPPP